MHETLGGFTHRDINTMGVDFREKQRNTSHLARIANEFIFFVSVT